MIESYTEGVIAGATAVFLAGLFWFVKWMHKPCKPYAGPRIAVYVQHGETHGWIKKFNGTPNPELTLDIWERLVAPARTIVKDLKLLYGNGWILSICTGINKMEVFGTESYSFSEYDTRKGKPPACHCGDCKGGCHHV